MMFLGHGSIDGIGDVWSGVLHPVRCPSHLLVLAVLALIAGQRSRFAKPIICFLIFASVGLLGTQTPWVPAVPSVVPGALGLVLSLLVVIRSPLSRYSLGGIFACAGLVLGWDSAPDSGVWSANLKLLFGTWIGLVLIVLNLANYVAMIPKKPVVRLGFRVLGSWIVAIEVLDISLKLNK
ncbi:MAG: hypothetical protein RLZZ399_229 [Verrucomicrobiota bacterium]|jgi:hydrogenase/urease accessory protein HupE